MPQLLSIEKNISERNDFTKDYPGKVIKLSSLPDEIREQPDRFKATCQVEKNISITF